MTTIANPKTITVDDILCEASKLSGFTLAALLGPSRWKDLVRARHIAMYVCRQRTGLSYPQIAKAFGGRDHTTVMHAENKIAALIFAEDKKTCSAVGELESRLDALEAGDE